MKEALQAAGFTSAAAMICLILRSAHRQAGAAAAIAAGLMLFFSAAKHLSAAAEAMNALAQRAGVGREMVGLLLKMTAMAYISEFSVQACRDAGEEGLAAKAGLCGKMLLMAQTLPLITEIGELTLSLAP